MTIDFVNLVLSTDFSPDLKIFLMDLKKDCFCNKKIYYNFYEMHEFETGRIILFLDSLMDNDVLIYKKTPNKLTVEFIGDYKV